MTFYLSGYTDGAVVASISRSETARNAMLERGWVVLDLTRSELYRKGAVPQSVAVVAQPGQADALVDYDVVEIDERGIVFVLYAACSNSNALFITGRCNSNCIMCPNSEALRRNSKVQSLAYLEEILSHIPSDAPYLTVTGGEPCLMGRDFLGLVDALNRRLPETSLLLLTNGRAFANRSFAQGFSGRATRLWRAAIPLHADLESCHDAISRTAGSFRQTMAGLCNIAGSPAEIEIRIVVSRLNHTCLEGLAQKIAELPRITHVNFIGLEMMGDALVNADRVWLDYRVAFPSIRRAVDLLMHDGIDCGLYNFPLCSVEPAYWSLCAHSISDYKVCYEERCGDCAVKTVCGGLFSSTRRFGRFQVEPVRGRTV